VAAFPTPHVAQVLAYEEDGAGWIEGERGDAPEPTLLASIPCYLFVPLGTEEQSARSRKITRPTVMWDPADITPAGAESPRADDELLITAIELSPATGAETVRWQIEGQPQPFGPPGEAVVGVQANLKRVEG
jgi:hypothetical protein